MDREASTILTSMLSKDLTYEADLKFYLRPYNS